MQGIATPKSNNGVFVGVLPFPRVERDIKV